MLRVIHEVDVALRSLIEREAADGTEVEVVFDAPTKDWASRRNVPTIDVYLYDIREDLRRRERGLINDYDGDRVSARHLPPRHFKLSYLVTAWTQRPEDEHRLLSALLACFLRHDALPQDLVTGPLAELGLPVPVTVALPPPEDRSFADVWSALGGELKPSLDIVVSAPTDTGRQYRAAPPVVAPSRVSLGGLGGWPPREIHPPRPIGAARDPGHGVAADERDARDPAEPAADLAGERGGPAVRSAGGSAGVGRAGDGTAGPAWGMSWQELAHIAGVPGAGPEQETGSSAGGRGSPKGSASAGSAGEDAGPAGEADKAAGARPPTRRRQGGISQR